RALSLAREIAFELLVNPRIESLDPRNGNLRVIPTSRLARFFWRDAVNSQTREEIMTRNNWIACAILASATAIGACSPKGGQAGQPDRAVDQQNQASDQNYNNDRGTDKTARNQIGRAHV